ncbi:MULTISPECIES: hypothetical protein [Cyanophyceae]|uniref:Glutathione S-transferase n=1 Tax=Nodularia spumigena CENA596 TaxID=1819295 RepID=A0A166IVG0_NODSP|nr:MULTISPECIES: hypothetical protein [Cyanophyceae]MDB9358714.1 hypothetical protein [Nodularia spumigena CS-587/03]KZL48900.1 hypothetical protein A2T98_15500 [Nodularia spumigena CENA596]MDB9306922.1 hypothetical protein [Nodularia spumigena CS-591/12]MDB9322921.1 hypothetical protein [Nodularia spumigena CS-591/07A]MDB9329443.1 hypothetical protein [Nodularia spumigena CS-591/04]
MRKNQKIGFWVLIVSTSILVWLTSYWGTSVVALPPPEDIPEEILRTEIIIDARSPIDGKPLNSAEYAELQEQLQVSPPPKLSAGLRQTVFLIQLRKALLQIFPFLDI